MQNGIMSTLDSTRCILSMIISSDQKNKDKNYLTMRLVCNLWKNIGIYRHKPVYDVNMWLINTADDQNLSDEYFFKGNEEFIMMMLDKGIESISSHLVNNSNIFIS